MDIVGYTSTLTAAAGDSVDVMVSSVAPSFRAELVRLIHGDEHPGGPGFKVEHVEADFAGTYDGQVQLLRPGSYMDVDHGGAWADETAFTVSVWVAPTLPTVAQTIWSSGSIEHGGFALRLEDSHVTFHSRSGACRVDATLGQGAWHHVTAAVDRAAGRVRVTVSSTSLTLGTRVTEVEGPADCAAYGRTLLAAEEVDGDLSRFFNGKLEAPSVHPGLVDPADVGGATAWAAWDFLIGIDSWDAHDVSGHGWDTRLVNQPTRGVTGRSWDGQETSWRHASDQYGAVHFHDDDLGDAGWTPSFSFVVDDALPSGVYVIHLTTDQAEDYVPLVVRPPRGRPRARAVMVVPTFSYLAYANEHLMTSALLAGTFPYPVQPNDRYIMENRLHSLYDRHSDGSGVCYSSRLRPIVNMRPKVYLTWKDGGKGAAHQLNADLHVVDWLDHFGYDVDFVTDEDLHHEGLELLAPYAVVVTGSHAEYWSGAMIDATQAYLRGGGRMVNLSGNGMYWVTALDPATSSMVEIRRRGPSQRLWEPEPGEAHLSTTGELGGIWRFRGKAPQTWLGIGFTAETSGHGRPYRRLADSHDPRAAWLFEGVETDLIGDVPSLVNSYGAAGYEFDRLDHALGTPAHTLHLAVADGFDDFAQGAPEDVLLGNSEQGGTVNPLVRADMVLLEYANGGAVFSPGSIQWAACLSHHEYDNSVSRVTRNALDRFLELAAE